VADETFDTVQGRAGSKAFGPSIGADRKESAVVEAFLLSFAVIFVAELGDKSQLMALAFATRYRAAVVLTGITVATAVVHLLSVALGAAVGAAIPERAVAFVAGLAFLGFGAWTVRGDRLSDEDEARAARSGRSAVLSVGTVFFLAELGDKTMLATVTLATTHGVVGTWLGSTLGMVAADALAIVVGRVLGTRLPERAIRIGAAVAFFAFGALLLLDAFRGGSA
jgi:putative Ca2+/H+ antiporter (TMEM165/GDT1 family)